VELDGRVAIVTGGAVRLGKAIALALAGQGARIAIHYNSSAGPAHETAEQIKAAGSDAVAIQADLLFASQASSVVTRTLAHFGRVDVLINSAAIFEPGRWDDTTEENWDRHFAINLKAPFFLSQVFARQIPADQRAHIVNLADWRGERPGTGYMAYTMTKAALIAMTKSLALALAPNIQVNAIAPGLILPPPGQDRSYLEARAGRIPAQRPGTPQEIAQTVLFLLGSDFVTGDLIYVTGGQHL
jgi:pteridine reductase